ncbi:MAG: hypothetical protein ACRCZ2_00020 [Fusobacteriaceae bacterium]
MPKKIAGSSYEVINKEDIKKNFELKIKFDKCTEKVLEICDVVKISNDGNLITFIEFYDFSKLNPVIKAWYRYKNEAKKWEPKRFVFEKKLMNSKTNPLIIHRKDEMYDHPYYLNENDKNIVKISKEWTKFYEESEVRSFKDKTKIGRKLYWDKCLEELKQSFPERFSYFEKYL